MCHHKVKGTPVYQSTQTPPYPEQKTFASCYVQSQLRKALNKSLNLCQNGPSKPIQQQNQHQGTHLRTPRPLYPCNACRTRGDGVWKWSYACIGATQIAGRWPRFSSSVARFAASCVPSDKRARQVIYDRCAMSGGVMQLLYTNYVGLCIYTRFGPCLPTYLPTYLSVYFAPFCCYTSYSAYSYSCRA